MKLTQVFQFGALKPPTTIEPRGERHVPVLLARGRRWFRRPRADAVDFQDTQPSVRENTGPRLR